MRVRAGLILLSVVTATLLFRQPVTAQNVHDGYIPQGATKCVEIGNFYLRRKDYKGALSRFKEAVRTDPTYAPGYLGLGKVYERTGQKRKALAAFKKYLDALPSEKQAEDAKGVHKTIQRLELGLKHSPAIKSRGTNSPTPRK